MLFMSKKEYQDELKMDIAKLKNDSKNSLPFYFTGTALLFLSIGIFTGISLHDYKQTQLTRQQINQEIENRGYVKSETTTKKEFYEK